jgi:hypothetical protein
VEGGTLGFDPVLLRPDEFLPEPREFRFYDVAGEERTLDVVAGSLVFTFCQVPVVYERTGREGWTRAVMSDGAVREREGSSLDRETSREVFGRTGRVVRLEVGIPKDVLYSA